MALCQKCEHRKKVKGKVLNFREMDLLGPRTSSGLALRPCCLTIWTTPTWFCIPGASCRPTIRLALPTTRRTVDFLIKILINYQLQYFCAKLGPGDNKVRDFFRFSMLILLKKNTAVVIAF